MKKVQMKRVSLANAMGKTLPRNLSTHTQTVARVLFSSAPIYKHTHPHNHTYPHHHTSRMVGSVFPFPLNWQNSLSSAKWPPIQPLHHKLTRWLNQCRVLNKLSLTSFVTQAVSQSVIQLDWVRPVSVL